MYGGGFGGGVFVAHGGSFTMLGGIIFNNTAISGIHGGGIGGGVYVNGSFVMSYSVIDGNTASVNGGGIFVTNTNNVIDFERLFVGENAAFYDNRASVAYSRASTHDAVYEAQIKGTSWTSPFTQGYNNYDISYTAGMLLTYGVSVSGNYSSPSGAGTYLTDSTVTVNAGSRSGYTFSGWTVTEGGITLSNTATATFTMPARNVAITANWMPVTSGGDGGSGGSGSGGSGSGGESSSKPSPSPSTATRSEPSPSTPSPSPSPSDSGNIESKFPITTVLVLVIVVLVIVVLVVVGIVVWLLRKGPKA
jgi:uncharacterized repeat protein (TIGR02543 family)